MGAQGFRQAHAGQWSLARSRNHTPVARRPRPTSGCARGLFDFLRYAAEDKGLAREAMDALTTGSGDFDLRRRLLQIEMLCEAGLALQSSLDPVQVAEEILQRALVMVDARAGALWVRGVDGSLAQVATAGFSEAALTRLRTIVSQAGIPAQAQQVATSPPVGDCLCIVPLVSRQGTIGVLAVADHEARDSVGPFHPEDESLLWTFANQAGAALHNARLHGELAEEIHSRQRAENELTEQRLRAFEADRLHALGEMASGVAHELNQPLNGIRTFAESAAIAIERGWATTPAETLQTYHDIIAQVDRMVVIIDHMRVFARGPEGTLQSDLNVNESVDGAMKLLGAQMRVHGIAVEQQLARDLPVRPGSQNEIEQVVINLLSNARDALDGRLQQQRDQDPSVPAGWRPRIAVRTTHAAGTVQLSIGDNGGGIPEAAVGRVFDPFFTTKPAGKGTGIGLSIVRGIVERHQGTIEIDNRPGDGVEFVVRLPL